MTHNANILFKLNYLGILYNKGGSGSIAKILMSDFWTL